MIDNIRNIVYISFRVYVQLFKVVIYTVCNTLQKYYVLTVIYHPCLLSYNELQTTCVTTHQTELT
jgi:hypothetical protein